MPVIIRINKKNWCKHGLAAIMRNLLLFLLLYVCIPTLYTQSADYVVIENITIKGNQRTKTAIILRELTFGVLDTIPINQLTYELERSEEQVINMGLFNNVEITLSNWIASNNHIAIKVDLSEAWPIYPIPIFELADRNFNVWWVEQGRSLERVKYGLDFSHNNLSGWKDRLELRVERGYSQLYSARYIYPYLNRKKTLGLEAQIIYEQRKELDYNTYQNKQLFYRSPSNDFVFRRFGTSVGIHYRPHYNWSHSWIIGYNNKRVDAYILEQLHLKYFSNSTPHERSIDFIYKVVNDRRDFKAYPLQGTYAELQLTKLGLGFFKDRNTTLLDFTYNLYQQWPHNWSAGVEFLGRISLNRNQLSFHESKVMGYSKNTLHGYEYYIVNGLDRGILKTFVRRKLIDFEMKFGRIMPIKAFRNVPIKVYGKINNDVGMANDPFNGGYNFLNRKLLWGGGPSIDLVFYYDIIIQIEYSFNNIGEKGLFLHFDIGINN